MVISVPIGTDNGVTLESDFEVVGEDNTTVLIYPQEIYGGRFDGGHWLEGCRVGSGGRCGHGQAGLRLNGRCLGGRRRVV